MSKRKVEQVSSDNESDNSSESEFEAGKIVTINYQDKEFEAIEADMDERNWVRIDDRTPDNIKAVCSFGFATCIAIICKSSDNKYISLIHASGFEESNINSLKKLVRNEVLIMQQKTAQTVEVIIGFSQKNCKEILTYYPIDGDSEERIKEEKSNNELIYVDLQRFLSILETDCNYQIIDLPQGSVLINENGINTSITEDLVMEDESDEISESSESPESQIENPYITTQSDNKRQRTQF
jgi:hypothetical protein